MTNSALAERTETRQVASPAATNESTAMLTMIQRAATDPAFDADKMQKMMEMYERHTDRTAAAAFNAAMVRAQAEIGPVFRDKFNAQTSSAYAALESIDRKISPVYTIHGFSLSFGTGDSPLVGHIRTVCDCMHEAGHTKTYHVDLPIDSAGIKGSVNKTGVHAAGSTFSYARRYLTMMIFNVVLTNEDDDGNGAGPEPAPDPVITAGQAAQLDALLQKCSQVLQDNFKAKYGCAANVFKSEFDAVSARISKAASRPQE
ncbi:ERF family protein [Pseudomonas sp.]|uniref:ERF family protein n=1 Tax=Pseudomonas sp. TaxID=306 RepID=UPI003D6E5851